MGRIEDALRKAKQNRRQSTGDASESRFDFQSKMSASLDDKKTPSSLMATVPHEHQVPADPDELRETRVIAASDRDERVGPYRQLRTQILKTLRDNNWNTLAITSPNEGAGKSLTASNLAISLCRDSHTTVTLVDLDLNTPTLHKKLNLEPEYGLADYLEGRVELKEVLFSVGVDGLTVIAGRPVEEYSSELLSSPRMQRLAVDISKQNKNCITIYDLPPILRNDDAIMFTPYADAVLLVVEDSVTTEKQLRQSLQLMRKANVLGTILNKVRE